MSSPRLLKQGPVVNHLRRVRIELFKSHPDVRSLLFIGVSGGEGVSSLAASFALDCARDGHLRVALIDTNTPPAETGTLLAGAGKAAAPLAIYARSDLEGAADAPVAERLRLTLQHITNDHDLTICDAPVLGRDAISAELAGLVDGVLVVVEANVTLADQLILVRERLERANARILGAVINRQGRFMPHLSWRWLRQILGP